jgi:hypothetical protein
MHKGFAANLNKLVLLCVLVPLLAVGMQYYNDVSRAGVQDTVALALLGMYVMTCELQVLVLHQSVASIH